MAHSDKQTGTSPKTSDPVLQTCPQVSDLIDFALGRSSASLSDQVREHLMIDNCHFCRRWVEQAAQHRTGPSIDWMQLDVGPLRQFTSSNPSSDPTPVPENAKWQRQAFRDLEARLANLEQS